MQNPYPNEALNAGEQVIATRSFHDGNLSLRLIFSPLLDLFRIHVYRHNDRSSHELWGLWLVGEGGQDRPAIQLDATRKFMSISL